MPIFTYLDLSTAHISLADSKRLTKFAAQMPMRVIPHEYGWWINVPSEEDRLSEVLRDLRRKFGMTAAFRVVIETAHDEGCYWINLDQDADRHPGLRTHPW